MYLTSLSHFIVWAICFAVIAAMIWFATPKRQRRGDIESLHDDPPHMLRTHSHERLSDLKDTPIPSLWDHPQSLRMGREELQPLKPGEEPAVLKDDETISTRPAELHPDHLDTDVAGVLNRMSDRGEIRVFFQREGDSEFRPLGQFSAHDGYDGLARPIEKETIDLTGEDVGQPCLHLPSGDTVEYRIKPNGAREYQLRPDQLENVVETRWGICGNVRTKIWEGPRRVPKPEVREAIAKATKDLG